MFQFLVPAPPTITSVVERALADAETLLREQGPTSAVDRVHTALHGYLLAACQRHGVTAGIHCGSIETAQRWRERGFRMFNVTSDGIFLRNGAAQVVKTLAGEPAPARPASSSYA